MFSALDGLFISTYSEVFFNRIPSSRVSWYFNMSCGNDFYKKQKMEVHIFECYLQIFLETSPLSIGKMAFQHWFFCMPSSKFIVPVFENISTYNDSFIRLA